MSQYMRPCRPLLVDLALGLWPARLARPMRTGTNRLHVYRDPAASVVVREYEVYGESLQTGRPYDNRFVSIVEVRDERVTRWRDYLDPVAVFDATTGWPAGLD